MKKRFFRSLENLLGKKMVVLPFLGLLAASAALVWSTAFVPRERETGGKETGEDNTAGKKTPEGERNSPEAITSQEMRAAGTEFQGEHRQCKAITKKGTRCQHIADESGYCRQHRALFEQQVPAETNPHL